MIFYSNAKINLGLFITEKRKDGFHNLESLFLPVPWSDQLEIVKSEKFGFSAEGIEIEGEAQGNLCVKAYELLQKDFDLPPVSIHLTKNIPIGAGLGGGSSNAAFTLKAVNQIFNLGLSEEQLIAYATQLGSDCTFFIRNQPAIASGKGDILKSVSNFKFSTYCLLVYPNLHIETRKAYEKVKPRKSKYKIAEIIQSPPESWQEKLINDFEASLLGIYPELNQLKNQLIEMKPSFVSMSGSGSAFYAFFKEKPSSLPIPDEYPRRIFKLAF